ncbi:hypothetical protein HK098_002785 [Nowakowskiella sp. JEL0407]|nr:hypothetical protein HK098_002785 [Nowakowskiella sp. JEL0407]
MKVSKTGQTTLYVSTNLNSAPYPTPSPMPLSAPAFSGQFYSPIAQNLSPTVLSDGNFASLSMEIKKRVYCDWQDCTASFTTKSHLGRHYRTHLNLKPFICNICTKKFSRKDNLNQHIQTHERRKENAEKKASSPSTAPVKKRKDGVSKSASFSMSTSVPMPTSVHSPCTVVPSSSIPSTLVSTTHVTSNNNALAVGPQPQPQQQLVQVYQTNVPIQTVVSSNVPLNDTFTFSPHFTNVNVSVPYSSSQQPHSNIPLSNNQYQNLTTNPPLVIYQSSLNHDSNGLPAPSLNQTLNGTGMESIMQTNVISPVPSVASSISQLSASETPNSFTFVSNNVACDPNFNAVPSIYDSSRPQSTPLMYNLSEIQPFEPNSNIMINPAYSTSVELQPIVVSNFEPTFNQTNANLSMGKIVAGPQPQPLRTSSIIIQTVPQQTQIMQDSVRSAPVVNSNVFNWPPNNAKVVQPGPTHTFSSGVHGSNMYV